MKRLNQLLTTLTIILLMNGYEALGQACSGQLSMTDGVCNYQDWDWWSQPLNDNNICKNWIARISKDQNSNVIPLSNPFWDDEQPDIINRIALTKDYLPENGWVCLKRNFGCIDNTSYPHFILYNRYTGIIRIFYFWESVAANSYIITLKIINSTTNSMIASGINDIDFSQQQYREDPSLSQDKVAIYVGAPSPSGKWIMGEFYVGMDTDYNNKLINNAQMRFSVSVVTTSTLKAKINGESFTNDMTLYGKESEMIKTIDADENGNKAFNNIKAKFGKVSKSVTEASKFVEELGKFAKDVSDPNGQVAKWYDRKLDRTFAASEANGFEDDLEKTKRVYKNRNNVLGFFDGLQKFAEESALGKVLSVSVKAVPVVSSILSTVESVFGLVDKSAQDPNNNSGVDKSIATFTSYDLTVEGEIKTELPVGVVNMYIPGNLRGNSPISKSAPYFDCELGVIALENTPILEKMPFKNYFIGYKDVRDGTLGEIDLGKTFYLRSKREYNVVEGGLAEPLYSAMKFDRNFSSYPYFNCKECFSASKDKSFIDFMSLRLKNDLTFRINQTLEYQIKDLKGALVAEIDSNLFFFSDTIAYTQNYQIEIRNQLIRDIESGILQIYGYDKIKKRVILGSPLVDFKFLKNYTINVPSSSEVYIKIVGQLSYNSINSDLMFTKKYHVKNENYPELQRAPTFDPSTRPYNQSTNNNEKSNVLLLGRVIPTNDKPKYTIVNSEINTWEPNLPQYLSNSTLYLSPELNKWQKSGVYLSSTDNIDIFNTKFEPWTSSFRSEIPKSETIVKSSQSTGLLVNTIAAAKTKFNEGFSKPYSVIAHGYIELGEGTEIALGTNVEFRVIHSNRPIHPSLGEGRITSHAPYFCNPMNTTASVARKGDIENNNEANGTSTFYLYPNPVSSTVNLKLPNKDENFEIKIINTDGQVLYKSVFMDEMEIDVSKLLTGLYIVEARNENKYYVQKLIKE